jgi:hypothetical protein
LGYDEAIDELYQAPHDAFVAERRRLTSVLKAEGDRAGADKLAKAPRPTASAWVVDQLWWQARETFEQMFATAAQLRGGEFRAMPAHRETIAQLRAKAKRILDDAGHGSSEAVLRRVTTTLSALAIDGGFGEDRPGTLAVDRESPGFAAVGLGPNASTGLTRPPPMSTEPAAAPMRPGEFELDPSVDFGPSGPGASPADTMRGGGPVNFDLGPAGPVSAAANAAPAATLPMPNAGRVPTRRSELSLDLDSEEQVAAQKRAADAARAAEAARAAMQAAAEAAAAAAEAERRAREQEAARKAAEKQRLDAELRAARAELTLAERDAARIQAELNVAQKVVDKARALVEELSNQLDVGFVTDRG